MNNKSHIKEYNKKYYASTKDTRKEYRNKYQRLRRKRFKETGCANEIKPCIECGKICVVGRAKTCSKECSNIHRKKTSSKWQNERRRNLRKKILELLGNKCSNPNCLVPGGCVDIRCLQVDHINGGGCKEVAIYKEDYIRHLYSELLKGTDKYQLLCANCNTIKKVEKKEIITGSFYSG